MIEGGASTILSGKAEWLDFNMCQSSHGADYGLLTAGALISIVPVLVVYIVFQRYFVEGMSGAIKG